MSSEGLKREGLETLDTHDILREGVQGKGLVTRQGCQGTIEFEICQVIMVLHLVQAGEAPEFGKLVYDLLDRALFIHILTVRGLFRLALINVCHGHVLALLMLLVYCVYRLLVFPGGPHLRSCLVINRVKALMLHGLHPIVQTWQG